MNNKKTKRKLMNNKIKMKIYEKTKLIGIQLFLFGRIF
jgi:hypothetical protein